MEVKYSEVRRIWTMHICEGVIVQSTAGAKVEIDSIPNYVKTMFLFSTLRTFSSNSYLDYFYYGTISENHIRAILI